MSAQAIVITCVNDGFPIRKVFCDEQNMNGVRRTYRATITDTMYVDVEIIPSDA